MDGYRRSDEKREQILRNLQQIGKQVKWLSKPIESIIEERSSKFVLEDSAILKGCSDTDRFRSPEQLRLSVKKETLDRPGVREAESVAKEGLGRQKEGSERKSLPRKPLKNIFR